jgi:GT2 family glycosyltransferase
MLDDGFHIVYAHRINIDVNGNATAPPHKSAMHVYAPEALPYGNFITHPTVLMKKDVFYTVGGYRNFVNAEDYDLWLRLFGHGYKFGVIEEPLLYYRVRPESLSRNHFETYWADKYCRYLYQKEKNGHAVYSEENLAEYFRKRGGDSPQKRRKFNLAYDDLALAIAHIARHNMGAALRKLLSATIKNPRMLFIFMDRTHRLIKMRKIPTHQNENKQRGNA